MAITGPFLYGSIRSSKTTGLPWVNFEGLGMLPLSFAFGFGIGLLCLVLSLIGMVL